MKHLLVISIGAMLLFVVVCPLTPTPTAVVNGKVVRTLQVHPFAALVGCLAAVFIFTQFFFLSHFNEVSTQRANDVLQLTCVRLC